MCRLAPLAALVLSAFLVTGCGSAQRPTGRSGQQPSSPKDYGLVVAAHNDCAAQGRALAVYLDTGQPLSDDPTWGGQRQIALALSGEARALYIRRTADARLQRCDQQETAQEVAAAQVKAAADARAAALMLAANEKATCARVGATLAPLTQVCSIGYQGSDGAMYYYVIYFDSSGSNVAPKPNDAVDVTSCVTRYGPGVTGHWHPDTDVCSL